MKKISVLIIMLALLLSINMSAAAECTIDDTNPLNHTLNEGEVKKAATCGETGILEKTCTVCGATFPSDIPKLTTHPTGATTKSQYSPATCTSPAMFVETCNVCGARVKDPYPEGEALGHKYETTIVAPTCLSKGYTLHKCACGSSFTDNETDMVPHNYEKVKETLIEANCKQKGTVKVTEICSVCKTAKEPTTEEIPVDPTKHDYTVTETPAGYGVPGERKSVCKNCGNTKTEVIPALIEVKDVTISASTTSISVGGTASLTATVSPMASASFVRWEVADQSILSLSSENGTSVTATGKAVGTTTVKAIDNNSGKSDIMTITVSSSVIPPVVKDYYAVTYLPGIYSTGSPYSYSIPYGSPVYAIDNLFSRPGYRQDGWLINGSGTVYRNGSFIGAAYGDITLHPNWVANTQSYTLTVTYNNSLGSVYTGNSYVPSGTQYTIGPDTSITFTFAPAKGYYVYDCKLQNLRSYGSMDAFTVTSTRMAGANRNLVIDLRSIYDRPKTGDDSNIILWLSLAGVALVGGGVTMLVIKKKKK